MVRQRMIYTGSSLLWAPGIQPRGLFAHLRFLKIYNGAPGPCTGPQVPPVFHHSWLFSQCCSSSLSLQRPKSAYFFYLDDVRAEVNKEHPTASIGEKSKVMGEFQLPAIF